MKDIKNVLIGILLVIIVGLCIFIVLDNNDTKKTPKEEEKVQEKTSNEKIISCLVDPNNLGAEFGITDPNVTDFKYELIYYYKDNALVKRNEKVTTTYATTESLLENKIVRAEQENSSFYLETKENNKIIKKTEEIVYDETNNKMIFNTYLEPTEANEWISVSSGYETYDTALVNLNKIYDCK